ncbi:MAG: enolase C-terminal domain-like protein [Terriglobales bacterium]
MPDRFPITHIDVSAFTIPTDFPESDGTCQWDRITLVLVQAKAGAETGIGYTYADTATAELIRSKLTEVVQGKDALDVTGAWSAMVHSIRNLGRPGICSMAISAVDTCLWDLKARLLNLPLVKLFGQVHDGINIYGSGGFTSYSNEQLADQLSGWVRQGIPRVKMKIGRDPQVDLHRVRVAREAIGPEPNLFVDANGAYTCKQALKLAYEFVRYGVVWFEEPVSSDDLDGLRLIRYRAPAGMNIAAGEYGYDSWYFRRMFEAGAVDFLQADATRCAGFTGFLQAAALCEAHHLPLSAHCAPTLHVHVGCAAIPLRNLEYFHDHVRIENMLFDGVPQPKNGKLYPDLSRPGIGLELKRADAQRFAA